MGDFTDTAWEASYRTSGLRRDGTPVDILHDFYIPALSRAAGYDRVAGYFRSTSLAAASEGYTRFLGHEGHMRLVVGADMAAADVEAILAGDAARLETRLLAELEGSDEWGDAVRAGVALLAQMVASGALEVRVALRRHSVTGEALTIDSTADGYVHEKWFIMTDSAGHRLYGSGSLNESRTALVLNAENIDISCDWDGSPREQRRIEDAAADFSRLWENRHAALYVVPLPQAVREHLVRLRTLTGEPTEIDGTRAVPQREPSISPIEALHFAVLRDAPHMPGGSYIGMYSAPVSPWPHQEMVARRLTESYPYAYLLCDEVGLGKTIEAALAIRSLLLSGRARRVLILAPKSLTVQWQHELAEKAGLDFTISRARPGSRGYFTHSTLAGREYSDTDLYSPDCNIVSTGLASRRERAELLRRAEEFDIVLLDEAHYARRSNPQKGADEYGAYGRLYQLLADNVAQTLKGGRRKARALWLATATPMQIDAIEVYDLLRLTGRVGSFTDDPVLTQSYFDLLGRLREGKEELNAIEQRYLGRSLRELQATDGYLWSELELAVLKGRIHTAVSRFIKSGGYLRSDARDLLKPLFAASPLSRVMMRHTRRLLDEYRRHGELKSNLARREVLPLRTVEFTAAEADFYASLEDYCHDLETVIRQNNEFSRQMLAFYLSFLQLRFASSMAAAQKTLARRLERVRKTLAFGDTVGLVVADSDETDIDDDDDDDEGDIYGPDLDELLRERTVKDLEWEQGALVELLAKLARMEGATPSKIQSLLAILSGRRLADEHMRQTVIFTRFYDSLCSIREYLDTRAPGMRVGVFAGASTCYYDAKLHGYREVTREEIKNLFLAGTIEVLLCTDAAEGLNLQTADTLINFDLGWNPMKIEQRIGRIDRIGQRYDEVYVINMCYLGSAEEQVYGKIMQRLQEAASVVGEQQDLVLPIEPNEFRDLQSGKLKTKELEKIARDRLRQQKKNTAKMQLTATEQYEIYQRAHEQMARKTYPATIADLHAALTHSDYLVERGLKVDAGVLTLPAFGSFGGLAGAIDRELGGERYPFITWGSEALSSLLTELASYVSEASNIHRLEVTSAGVSIVGYLVQTTSGPRLITAYSELADIELASAELTAEDVTQGQSELAKRADAELKELKQVERVLATSATYAEFQHRLVVHTAIAILSQKRDAGVEMYSAALREIAENPRKTYTVELPAEFRDHDMDHSLFALSSPVGKNTAIVSATGILTAAAVALCNRESSQLRRKKRSKQTCNDIITRLQRLLR